MGGQRGGRPRWSLCGHRLLSREDRGGPGGTVAGLRHDQDDHEDGKDHGLEKKVHFIWNGRETTHRIFGMKNPTEFWDEKQ